jgi:hypothetical protein
MLTPWPATVGVHTLRPHACRAREDYLSAARPLLRFSSPSTFNHSFSHHPSSHLPSQYTQINRILSNLQASLHPSTCLHHSPPCPHPSLPRTSSRPSTTTKTPPSTCPSMLGMLFDSIPRPLSLTPCQNHARTHKGATEHSNKLRSSPVRGLGDYIKLNQLRWRDPYISARRYNSSSPFRLTRMLSCRR